MPTYMVERSFPDGLEIPTTPVGAKTCLERAATIRKIFGGAAVAVAGLAIVGVPASGAGEPNCVEFFAETFGADIANHGQHIVGDYVTGTWHDRGWPPAGGVGSTIGGSGALAPGQSGIQQHGFSPGASFCNGSSSPSTPPGRG